MAGRLLSLILLLAAASPRAQASSVFSKVLATGDVGAFGSVGPPGRTGGTAVVTDDSRVLIFGGSADNQNGDYLNDMWLYDWQTGARAR